MEEKKSSVQQIGNDQNTIIGREYQKQWTLTFEYTETQYKIQLEDKDTGRFFRRTIQSSEIPELTQLLIRKGSPVVLHKVFLQTLQSKNEDCNLSISNEGEIKIFIREKGGKFTEDQVFQFQISTKEQKLEPIERLENVVKRLSSNFSKITSETSIKSMYLINHTQLQLNFDSNTYNKAQFTFTENNRAVQFKGSGTWIGVYTEQKLPTSGQYYAEFKIEQTVSKSIMVGLSKRNLYPNNPAFYSLKSNTSFYLTGNYYSDGAAIAAPYFIFTNDVITLLIDMDEMMLRVLVNGYPISGAGRVNTNGLDQSDYYVCFDFCTQNDQILLL